MPVVIGAKRESTFEDPIGLLGDCHRRVERFLGVLVKIAADARGGALSGEQHGALETALAYFRNAAPKHTADEEESLFPRMRAHATAEMGAVMERIAGLEADHAGAGPAHEEIDRLGRRWLDQGTLEAGEAQRLAEVLDGLSAMYRRHIAVEENEVFPAAAAGLTGEEMRAVGEEMAARRGSG
jgi:hemerythrin-like domain-containing protein